MGMFSMLSQSLRRSWRFLTGRRPRAWLRCSAWDVRWQRAVCGKHARLAVTPAGGLSTVMLMSMIVTRLWSTAASSMSVLMVTPGIARLAAAHATTCSALAVLLAGKVAAQLLTARGLVSALKIPSLAKIADVFTAPCTPMLLELPGSALVQEMHLLR